MLSLRDSISQGAFNYVLRMGDNCSPMSTRKQYHLYSTTRAARSHKGLIPGCEEGAILWIYQGELRQYDHMGISKSYQGNQTLSDLWDTPDQGKGRTSSHLGLIKWYTFNTAVATHQPSIWYLMCAWRTHRTVPGASAQLCPPMLMRPTQRQPACLPALLAHLDTNPQFHAPTWFCTLFSSADHIFDLNPDSPSDWFLTAIAS